MRGEKHCERCGIPASEPLAGRIKYGFCRTCRTENEAIMLQARNRAVKDAARLLRNAARRKHNRDIKEGLLAAARMVWWMDNEEADHG